MAATVEFSEVHKKFFKTYEIPLGAGAQVYSKSCAEMAEKNIVGVVAVMKNLNSNEARILPLPVVSTNQDEETECWIDTNSWTINVMLNATSRIGYVAQVTFILD
jgi:hypothetical protein